MVDIKAKDQQGLEEYKMLLRFRPAVAQSTLGCSSPLEQSPISKMLKLSQNHELLLIGEGLSRPETLAEQVVLLHRRFREIKISPPSLIKLPQQVHWDQEKGGTIGKILNYQNPELHQALFIQGMIEQIKNDKVLWNRIIFEAEAVFSTATYPG